MPKRRRPAPERKSGPVRRPPPVIARVREWHDEEGWGVVDAPETPGGCFVMFAVIEMPGYRTLVPGTEVVLHGWEPGPQDGCDFRALRVIPLSL